MSNVTKDQIVEAAMEWFLAEEKASEPYVNENVVDHAAERERRSRMVSRDYDLLRILIDRYLAENA